MEWSALIGLASRLEEDESVYARLVALGDSGADMKAALQGALNLVRDGRRGASLAFLGELARRGWKADVLPYVGALVDLVVAGGPAADTAVALLVRAARIDAESVSTSLFIRWPDAPGEPFERLIEALDAVDPAIAQEARPRRPDRHPTSIGDALAQIGAAEGPLLVATGQYNPGDAVRIGVLGGGRVIADLWLAAADLERFVGALRRDRTVRIGAWDVMYATGWGYAWTDDGGPFEVWDRDGRLAWVDGAELVVRGGVRVAVADVECVHAYVEDGWCVRGVRCVAGDKRVDIAQVRDVIAQIDPTYDAINLSFEAAWARALAEAIGAGLGKPVAVDEPL